MREINLKHLHYFWVVAREGSIIAASERLFVTPQTISAQLKQLESGLDQPLFNRRGTGLALTPAGEIALGYADGIFDLRRELSAALSAERAGGGHFRIGIADAVPKLIASLVLLPATQQQPPVRLLCREGDQAELTSMLVSHKLDCILSDHASAPDPNLRLYNHELGDTGISFMAAPALIEHMDGTFPDSLHAMPFLMPGRRTALRTTLESWLLELGIEVRVAGEFDDSALIKTFGQRGAGVFTCPTAIEPQVSRQYGVEVVGRTKDLRERFFLISRSQRPERELFHTIVDRARVEVFIRPADY